jgi:hypothetical protein
MVMGGRGEARRVRHGRRILKIRPRRTRRRSTTTLDDDDRRRRSTTHDDDDDERCAFGAAGELTEHEAASFVHAMSE